MGIEQLEQIRSTIRMWMLLDMVKLEASNYVGIPDKYIDNKRKQIEHDINAMLHYIAKKYVLNAKRPLEDYTDHLYELFVMEVDLGDEKLAELKDICTGLIIKTLSSSSPAQSS